ncbi:snoRNA-binding rRNA-processing protein [Perkinsus chesapeaki]|uniref:SnoRNA-binding rRNA-processing protein n=1 Tax=Perkinsus chesapeaki TaxID=330153 RepID=A0A7J6MA57_PERCH|nr:snoRNA-binding rRNA-processing protein [Perkinsus chesapeaki]
MPVDTKPSPNEPQTDQEDSEQLNIRQAEEAASEVIEVILDAGGRMLYKHRLEEFSIKYAAKETIAALQSHIDVTFVPLDPGDDILRQELRKIGGDLPEDEDMWACPARPPPIDSWAKFAVPVRVVESIEETASTASVAESASGMRTMDFGKQLTAMSKGEDDRSDGASTLAGGSDPRVIHLEVHEEDGSDEEEETLRENKQVEAKEKIAKEKAIEDHRAEQAAKIERVSSLAADLHSKPYAHDPEGNIVWIEKVNEDKLPDSHARPNYNLQGEGDIEIDAPQDPRSRGTSSDNRTSSSGSKKSKARTATSKASRPQTGLPEAFIPPAEEYTRLNTVQPSAVSTMTMSTGVTLMEKGKTLQGSSMESSLEEESPDKKLMSCEEYAETFADSVESHGS